MLLIGLGNPGEEYAGTYHNVGWEILEFFKEKLEKEYGPAETQSGKHFTFRKYGDYRLIYPDTFMNRSGLAIESSLDWFKSDPSNAIVFHDDSDLAIGEYKDGTGGAAGHHGAESILETNAGKNVLRVRIGIRDPKEKNGEHPRRKAGEFVLKKISPQNIEELREKVFKPLAQRFLGGC